MQQEEAKIEKVRKGKRYYFNKIVMLLNHIAVVALLASYLAPYVSPENFWMLAFFGLAYPFILVLNIIFVFYWLLLYKRKVYYSLLAILIGIGQLTNNVQLSRKSTPDKSKKNIKVMSYNVKVFDLYNWTHNTETRSGIFDLIADESPDIMCFQEFFSRDSSKFNNLDTLLKFQKAKYSQVEYTSHARLNQHFGIATFSSYPIITEGKIYFDKHSNNICIYSDLLVATDTIRVYNMHLQSIAFIKEDYKYIEAVQNNEETENLEPSKNILKRLKRAFVKRSKQADLIAEHIAACKYPVIVCGDFNDTPNSYCYKAISNNLSDAFVKSGNGFGRSYTGIFPSFRIDYILYSKQFKSYQFRTIREELSDHYPVCTYLELE
jgi:endonuclease/exonuclease/phosphatase family metal-dependent hydrolase